MPPTPGRSVRNFALFVVAASAGAVVVMSAAPMVAAVAQGHSPIANSVTVSPSGTASPAVSPSPSPTPSPSPSPSPSPKPTGKPFKGTAAVGALFTVVKGKLQHFCTAAVVQSRHGDLAITAAHCMIGRKLGPKSKVMFAPGYHDGKFPYGKWVVRKDYVDRNWRLHLNPNDDVAFLLVGKPGQKIQKRTGGERLETNYSLPQTVTVIGYPDSTNLPITCTGPARRLHLKGYRQMVFDCGGYTDGTSGGPFLIPATKARPAKVIGVIGGYQAGGDTPSISYSPIFIGNVAALFKRASTYS
ncbi:MAG TPA: trypsin-like serine protease [Streptosporangiaceae bacterium]|nr:trypsin-like serine protease [Streptosporangiaceae bacterium]